MERNDNTLKKVIYNTVHHNDKYSVEGIADRINTSVSYIYRMCLPETDTDGPNASGVPFQLKYLIPLMQATGDYQILHFLCERVDHVAIPIPNPNLSSSKDLIDQGLTSTVELGDLIKEIQKATEDGTYTEKEKERVVKEGWEAIRAIVSVINCPADK